MCTLSFIPKADGFLVGMNRDELLTRGAAVAPSVHELDGIRSLYPTDVEGGTWIAATEHGNCWALLNRNGGDRARKQRSRGEIVTRMLGVATAQEAGSKLRATTPLAHYLPFRLVGIFSEPRQVWEWVWDGQELTSISHGWDARHWFSSGLSDDAAAKSRGEVFEAAWKGPGAGDAEWLRKTHCSHGDGAGAFSVCVHRDDASTLSYTEVTVSTARVSMWYQPGSPCRRASSAEISLARLHSQPVSTL